jgi:hypothetical protein
MRLDVQKRSKLSKMSERAHVSSVIQISKMSTNTCVGLDELPGGVMISV